MSARPDIEDLYTSFGGLVRARVRRFYNGDDADDVVSEVFMRVIEKIDTFRGESSPSTWLYQLTTRHCLNRLRDQNRRRELLDETPPGWGGAVTRADQEAHTLLRQILGHVDEETATIAVYYHLDRMTRDDVAALVGVSSRTVGYRLEALHKLAIEKGER